MTNEQPPKLPLTSHNLTDDRLSSLKQILPEVFSEGNSIDWEKLRLTLGENLENEDPKERFGLNWPGKRNCFKAIQSPTTATLLPDRSESVDFDTTENLYIEGDNLEVLKILQKSYLGKVKMIYIDPPYNTGNDFVYPDDYSESLKTYLQYTGQLDAEGRKFSNNNDTMGRFHSKWLNMMYPRLFLARNLLREDGCICVMISDVEYSNLRCLLNDIYGQDNYINTINVLTKVSAGASGGGEDKKLKKNIEYILIYAKNSNEFTTLTHLYSGEPIAKVIKEMKEDGESWKYTRILKNFNQRELVGETKDGSGEIIKVYRHKSYEMLPIAPEIKLEIQNGAKEEEAVNKIYSQYFESIFRDTNAQSSIRTRVMDYLGEEDGLFSIDYEPRSGRNKGQITTVYYKGVKKDQIAWLKDICERSDGIIIKKEKLGTLWDDIDYNNVGKEGDVPFPNGKKPIQLIQRCIDLVNDKDCLVLDFFSGSGSTAHAVMEHNKKDNGRRKSISVQLPHVIDEDDETMESVVQFCREQNIKLTIADIGKERIRRVITKLKAEAESKANAETDKAKSKSKKDSASEPSLGMKVEAKQGKAVVTKDQLTDDKLMGGGYRLAA